MTQATMTRPPASSKFTVTRGNGRKAHRTMIYGVGGIGKTSLGVSYPNVLCVDLEGGAVDFDVARLSGINNWRDLRAALASDAFDSFKAICIDSVSKCEEMARLFVIENVPAEKNAVATSLESYGFGKGYVYLVEEWKRFLADLERHYQAGRDIILIAHAQIGRTPNPTGEDYIRHEPRLYHGNGSSVRAQTVEWCDHVLFVNYDVSLKKNGKAQGSGTRTIYTAEEATHVAKSRTLSPDPIVYEKGDTFVWDAMRGAAATEAASAAPEI
jgi:hypothetical protein